MPTCPSWATSPRLRLRSPGIVRFALASRPARSKVPTLYIWGDADDTVGRVAAEGTAEFIHAPYQFEILPGVGHFEVVDPRTPAWQTVMAAVRSLTGAP